MLRWIAPLAVIVAACGSNDVDGTELANSGLDARSSVLSVGLGGCGAEIPNLDDSFLAALNDCGPNNAGKCVPASPLTPPSMTKQLAPCEGGSCVPLQFLRINKAPLKACTSFGKSKGVCVSRVIPSIDKLTFLPKDNCTDEERCAPCANPIDGKVTGICELGKPAKQDCQKEEPVAPTCPYKGKPLLNVAKLNACADEGMHCLPKAVVPAAFSALLGACPDPNLLCAPDKSIEANGQYIPKKCSSVGGAEGRCLHKDIPQVAGQAKLLPVDNCDAYERCAPCFDPLNGEALPSCKVACDPGPTTEAVVFKPCAEGLGRCAPVSAVPEDMQGNLSEKDCEKGKELCVPKTAVDRNAQPKQCDLKLVKLPSSKPGVCVEDVLSIGIALSQSDCQEGFKCTPCNNPLKNNAPTGLPGCPK